jgi:hypothetical protein
LQRGLEGHLHSDSVRDWRYDLDCNLRRDQRGHSSGDLHRDSQCGSEDDLQGGSQCGSWGCASSPGDRHARFAAAGDCRLPPNSQLERFRIVLATAVGFSIHGRHEAIAIDVREIAGRLGTRALRRRPGRILRSRPCVHPVWRRPRTGTGRRSGVFTGTTLARPRAHHLFPTYIKYLFSDT